MPSINRHPFKTWNLCFDPPQKLCPFSKTNMLKIIEFLDFLVLVLVLPFIKQNFLYIFFFLFFSAEKQPFPLWSLVVMCVSHLLLVVNSSINILVYCVLSTKFREEACKVWSRFRNKYCNCKNANSFYWNKLYFLFRKFKSY